MTPKVLFSQKTDLRKAWGVAAPGSSVHCSRVEFTLSRLVAHLALHERVGDRKVFNALICEVRNHNWYGVPGLASMAIG